MYEAISDVKKIAALAISDPVAILPMGVLSLYLRTNSGS
jgi:hypothetical protein